MSKLESKEIFDGNITIKTKHLHHLTQIYCLTYDRSGKFIITGGDDGKVNVYSIPKDRLIKSLCDQNDSHFVEEVENICRNGLKAKGAADIDRQMERLSVCDLAVNYENTLVAAAKHSGSIPVWNLQTFELVIKLEEQVFPIRSINFSPIVFNDNKKYLISTSIDGFMLFFAYNQNTLKFEPKSLHRKTKYDGERASSIAVHTTSGGVLIGVNHTLGVKEICKPKSKKSKTPVKRQVQSAIRLFSLTDGSGPKEEWKTTFHKSHSQCEYSFKFCHKSFRFASGCDKDSNLFVWTFDKSNTKWDSIIIDINSEGNKKSLRGKSKSKSNTGVFITELAFSCEDNYLITNLTDYTIKVWKAETGELVQHFCKYHSNEVQIIECHPIHDHVFMSAGYDSNIFIYDIMKGNVLRSFDCCLTSEPPKGKGLVIIHPMILQCSFSPNGQTITATDNFGNMTIFSCDSHKEPDLLDQLEEVLERIHTESDSEDDLTLPVITRPDMKFIEAVVDFETGLLNGIAKTSPTKSIETNEKKSSVKVKEKLDFSNKSMNKKLTNVNKSPVSVKKPKVIKKTSPFRNTNVKEPVVESSAGNSNTSEIGVKSPEPKTTISPKQTKLVKLTFIAILDSVLKHPMSKPFHDLTDLHYPDYRKMTADADICFNSIQVDLKLNKRFTLKTFNRDMNTVFENVKKYFIRKDLKIFQKALNLEEFYCNEMEKQFGQLFRAPNDLDLSSDEESDANPSTSKSKPNGIKESLKPTPSKPKTNSDIISEEKAVISDKPVLKSSYSSPKRSATKRKRNFGSKRTKKSSKKSLDFDLSEDKADEELDSIEPIISEQKISGKETEVSEVLDSVSSKQSVDESEGKAEEVEEVMEVIEDIETNVSKSVINGNKHLFESQKEISVQKNHLFCIFCDQTFESKTEATTHYITHLCPLKCVQCQQCFPDYDQYLTHSCDHPKTPENMEWCRHYSDSIVWIQKFLQFQSSEDIESFETIANQLKNCIVCEKLQQIRPHFQIRGYKQSVDKTDKTDQTDLAHLLTHIQQHLKYNRQYLCLICLLKEDAYFYCQNSEEALAHMSTEHSTYEMNGSNVLQFFDPSVPKLDEIIQKSLQKT